MNKRQVISYELYLRPKPPSPTIHVLERRFFAKEDIDALTEVVSSRNVVVNVFHDEEESLAFNFVGVSFRVVLDGWWGFRGWAPAVFVFLDLLVASCSMRESSCQLSEHAIIGFSACQK